MPLNSNDRMTRRIALPQATIGAGEIVLLDAVVGKYHGLKGPAARIWDLLQNPMSLNEICEKLVSEYDVEPDECRGDVEGFVRQLIDEKLIEVR